MSGVTPQSTQVTERPIVDPHHRTNLSNLPPELRLRIWKDAVDGIDPRFLRYGSPCPVPAEAQINRESRAIFLQSYRLVTLEFIEKYHEKYQGRHEMLMRYINFNKDTLVEFGPHKGRHASEVAGGIRRVLHYDPDNLLPFTSFGNHSPVPSFEMLNRDRVAAWKYSTLFPNSRDIWTVVSLNEEDWYGSPFSLDDDPKMSDADRNWYSFRCWEATGKVEITTLAWEDVKEMVRQVSLKCLPPFDRQLAKLSLTHHILQIRLIGESEVVEDTDRTWVEVSPRQDGESRSQVLHRALWRLAVSRVSRVLRSPTRRELEPHAWIRPSLSMANIGLCKCGLSVSCWPDSDGSGIGSSPGNSC